MFYLIVTTVLSINNNDYDHIGREKHVDKLFREFWKLKILNELYEIYPQIEHCIPSFLKLHKALKKRGLNPNNIEWFADAIETGAIKILEIQKQYAKIKDELEAI